MIAENQDFDDHPEDEFDDYSEDSYSDADADGYSDEDYSEDEYYEDDYSDEDSWEDEEFEDDRQSSGKRSSKKQKRRKMFCSSCNRMETHKRVNKQSWLNSYVMGLTFGLKQIFGPFKCTCCGNNRWLFKVFRKGMK